MVLACAEGHDNQAVARKLRVTPATVGKWRNRFVQDRLEGVYDEPRPGAPRTISDEQVEQVVVRTLESTPRGATHWSTREMAKASGHSHMTISRIWQAFGLQPHRSESFRLSSDPLLVPKVRDIVGLYMQSSGRFPSSQRIICAMQSRLTEFVAPWFSNLHTAFTSHNQPKAGFFALDVRFSFQCSCFKLARDYEAEARPHLGTDNVA